MATSTAQVLQYASEELCSGPLCESSLGRAATETQEVGELEGDQEGVCAMVLDNGKSQMPSCKYQHTGDNDIPDPLTPRSSDGANTLTKTNMMEHSEMAVGRKVHETLEEEIRREEKHSDDTRTPTISNRSAREQSGVSCEEEWSRRELAEPGLSHTLEPSQVDMPAEMPSPRAKRRSEHSMSLSSVSVSYDGDLDIMADEQFSSDIPGNVSPSVGDFGYWSWLFGGDRMCQNGDRMCQNTMQPADHTPTAQPRSAEPSAAQSPIAFARASFSSFSRRFPEALHFGCQEEEGPPPSPRTPSQHPGSHLPSNQMVEATSALGNLTVGSAPDERADDNEEDGFEEEYFFELSNLTPDPQDSVQAPDGEQSEKMEKPEDALCKAVRPVPSETTLIQPIDRCSSPRGQAEYTIADAEEEAWDARQRVTGAISRLVRYGEQDSPQEDILGLRCTRRGRVIVTHVRQYGIAWHANISAGDELVSIDGSKEFVGFPPHKIHASLHAPTVLVFVGFVGKLEAEVRVRRPPEPRCGLPPEAEVVEPPCSKLGEHEESPTENRAETIRIADTVIFTTQGCASVLLETTDKEVADEKRGLYELGREDARGLLDMALVEAIRDVNAPHRSI